MSPTSRSLRTGLAAALLAAFSIPSRVPAAESLFGYVYGTETAPAGEWEAAQWVTWRFGKQSGAYSGLDLRTEVEVGLTERLQAALYVDARGHRIHDVPGLEDRSSLGLQGVATEWKYRFRSPEHDGYGLAAYVEPGYSRIDRVSGGAEEELELEAKLIFEKRFLDAAVVWSVNYTLEPEWSLRSRAAEAEAEDTEDFRRELGEELATGVSIRFAPRWSAGAELAARSEWPDFSHREHLTVSLGPDLHYEGRRAWWTVTLLPQVWGRPDGPVPGLHLGERERLELRLLVGLDLD
jgi:Family of unknown function (DUF6662)